MSLFFYHAGAMVAGFLMMTVGIGIARFHRQKRWWLKAHKTLGMAGLCVMLTGLVAAFLMVDQDGGGHARVNHAWVGLSAIFFVFMTPVLGQLQFKIREKAKQLREKHRWSGRIALIVGLSAILSGLRAAGFI
jgi:cytochrome bd-type quinol oxidase subunit 2